MIQKFLLIIIFSGLCSLGIIGLYTDTVAPVITLHDNTTLYYTEEENAIEITSTLTITDDNRTISGAIVQMIHHYQYGEDELSYNASMPSMITVNRDISGALLLSGVAKLSDYQTALRAITYYNHNTKSPNTSIRTISFSVSDGVHDSLSVTRNIMIKPTNDAPILNKTHPLNLDNVLEQTNHFPFTF